MQWRSKLAAIITMVALITFGFSAQAQASQNIGWVYTQTGGGKAFFDADLAGYPGYEKLTVCDTKTDGKGVYAVLQYRNSDGSLQFITSLVDPSNDGNCRHAQYNMATDDRGILLGVCQYTSGDYTACTEAYGYA